MNFVFGVFFLFGDYFFVQLIIQRHQESIIRTKSMILVEIQKIYNFCTIFFGFLVNPYCGFFHLMFRHRLMECQRSHG